MTTLSEAARSLGASWFTVIVRVIAPNMRQAILNALILTSSLVLGEFTIAYLLLYNNLQVELYSISREYTERRRDLLHFDRRAAVRLRAVDDPVLRWPPPPRPGMRFRSWLLHR